MADSKSQLKAAEAEAQELAGLRELGKWRSKAAEYKRLLRLSEREREAAESAYARLEAIKADQSRPIKIARGRRSQGSSEHTAFALLSDTHSAEVIDPEEINGHNRHDESIGEERMHNYGRDLVKIVKDIPTRRRLTNLVLALMGDYLVGELHGIDSARSCRMAPFEEQRFNRRLLQGVIDHALNELDVQIHVPCVPGNHGRSTDKPRSRNAAEYNHEHQIHLDLAERYAGNEQIRFDVSKSLLKTVDVGRMRVLVGHGDVGGVRGGKGVGGLAVPFRRTMSTSWRPSYKCDLAVIGHFHHANYFQGVGFTNGCLCGPNAWSLHMGYPIEDPSQWVFTIDHEAGRVGTISQVWAS